MAALPASDVDVEVVEALRGIAQWMGRVDTRLEKIEDHQSAANGSVAKLAKRMNTIDDRHLVEDDRAAQRSKVWRNVMLGLTVFGTIFGSLLAASVAHVIK